MADPWADPNLQRPCTDRGKPDWPAAYQVALRYLPQLRQELSGADTNGGFWLHVAQPEQVACQWAWVIDGGKYGGSLILALQSRGVFTPTQPISTPEIQQQTGQAAGGTTGERTQTAVNDSLNRLTGWARNNPIPAAAIAGIAVFVLARR